eukprot:gb/GECG01011963.1/.p1 GENE.gb/GECG01011963.1/~~gb/GECG01011963.1/.p1  ORF type:complete len:186 (+),score=43.45 gb/GECG01011963.1/:1-558(+)
MLTPLSIVKVYDSRGTNIYTETGVGNSRTMASTSALNLLNVLSCTFDREEDVTEETERFSKVFEKSVCGASIKELERGSCSEVDQASHAVLSSLRSDEPQTHRDENDPSTPLEECSRYVKNIQERLSTSLKRAKEVRQSELEPNERAKQEEVEEREKQMWRDLWNNAKRKQEEDEEGGGGDTSKL